MLFLAAMGASSKMMKEEQKQKEMLRENEKELELSRRTVKHLTYCLMESMREVNRMHKLKRTKDLMHHVYYIFTDTR